METFKSDITGKEYPITEKISAKLIRHTVLSLIQQDNSKFNHNSFLSNTELNYYREKYISDYLSKEIGELSNLEKTVITALTENTTLSNKLDDDDQTPLTTGQRIADKVATFGGSWTFIISFGVFILLWICLNIIWLSSKAFDPYPFILLNLILSCLAAKQAPVIMMSQNRQEEKDREREKNDYMINLKSELEIRILHEKIDHLVNNQQLELIEIQKVQIEMLNDIITKVDKK